MTAADLVNPEASAAEPASRLPGSAAIQMSRRLEALAGQLRATSAMAPAAGPDAGLRSRRPHQRTNQPIQRLRADLAEIRANATLDSPAGRHALRLSVVVLIAQLIASELALSRSYWMVVAAATVLRPEFGATFTRGTERALGTGLGVPLAGAITVGFHPAGAVTVALVGLLAWAAYATFPASFAVGLVSSPRSSSSCSTWSARTPWPLPVPACSTRSWAARSACSPTLCGPPGQSSRRGSRWPPSSTPIASTPGGPFGSDRRPSRPCRRHAAACAASPAGSSQRRGRRRPFAFGTRHSADRCRAQSGHVGRATPPGRSRPRAQARCRGGTRAPAAARALAARPQDREPAGDHRRDAHRPVRSGAGRRQASGPASELSDVRARLHAGR